MSSRKKLPIGLVIGAIAAIGTLAGCELLVDFDRTKIVDEGGTDGTTTDVVSPQDVVTDKSNDVNATDSGDGSTTDASDGAVTDAPDDVTDSSTTDADDGSIDDGSSDGADE